MKIIVTGAGGFIGSHMVERCIAEGYDVCAFVRYKSDNHWGWLEGSPYAREIKIVSGDIRDYDSVVKATKGCDAVIHMAALIGIPYSYISPLAYIKTNIEGTYNILEASKNRSIPNVIVTSTSETYGTAEYTPIDEQHPLIGQSPYSATKIAADQLSISFHRSFDLPVKIARPFNTYGPRQSSRAIIPTIITQVLHGKKEIQLGNLTPTRDFTYVEDTVDGFMKILHDDSLIGEVTNIGSNHEISIANLADLISGIMEKDIVISMDNKRSRVPSSEVDRLRCDNTKIMQSTGWTPRITIEEGLQKTIQWVHAHLHRYKSEQYNV